MGVLKKFVGEKVGGAMVVGEDWVRGWSLEKGVLKKFVGEKVGGVMVVGEDWVRGWKRWRGMVVGEE